MGYKCSIPFCKGNYQTGPKVSVFGLPKEENLRQKWIKVIPRKDVNPNSNFKVCELHFRPDDIRRSSEYYDPASGKKISAPLLQVRLKENAVPCIFNGCPPYLSKNSSSRESPDERFKRIENEQLLNAIQESINEQKSYEERISFNNICELSSMLKNSDIPDIFTPIISDCEILLISVSTTPVPELSLTVVIDKDLMVSAFYKKLPLTVIDNFSLPMQIKKFDCLLLLLEKLANYKNNTSDDKLNYLKSIIASTFQEMKQFLPENNYEVIDFVNEQINLLGMSKTRHRYSPDLLVLCCLLHSISPHSYRFLRNRSILILPHQNSLKNLSSSYNVDPRVQMSDENFLLYAKEKFQYLKDCDKNINLMMDEIHLKPFLDFKCGDIIGTSYNSGKVANSAFVFMIQSLKSNYKDVIHIVPVKTISAEMLHDIILKIILKLENIGFNIICITSDNNAINKKAISFFSQPPKLNICYPNPANSKKPLFFIIDSVHLLKSVRNNWLNQKNCEQAMYYPSFANSSDRIKSASFHALKKLYELEKDGFVKCAHTLNAKSLSPTNIERQNVQLALNIFNLNVCESLKIVGPNNNVLNAIDTADYLNIIINWFDIMNVKSVFKGFHKRNVYQKPLTSKENDDSFFYLHSFLDWLEKWERINMRTGKLTRETMQALKQTTYAVIEMVKYCTEELGFEYILTGKIQTDALESRFGKYRQFAGSQYNISVTQVFEVEKKLRIQSMLPLALKSHIHGTINLAPSESHSNNNDESSNEINSDVPPVFKQIFVSQKDVKELDSLLPALTFVAGYCVHSVLLKNKCTDCKSKLLLERDLIPDERCFLLIKSLDRGGLKYPIKDVITITLYNYIILSKLLSSNYENEFLKVQNKRAVACKLTSEILNITENYLDVETCENDHSANSLCTEIIKKSTNVFLKNYCKKINDQLNFEAQSKKRKLSTLNKT